MLRARSIPSYLACLLVMLCANSMAANQPAWQQINSTHFTVITDAGEKKGREIAFRFEQMRTVFATLLGKDRLNQSVPLTILALANDKAYYQAAPLGQGQPIDVSGIFRARRRPGLHRSECVRSGAAGGRWRMTSLSCFCGTTIPRPRAGLTKDWQNTSLPFGWTISRSKSAAIPLSADPKPGTCSCNQRDTRASKSLTDLLGVATWMSLPDLFSMKHDAYARNEGPHQTLYYAESWIVLHYLLHNKKLPETGSYFDLVLNQHVPVEEAIQKAYGMSPRATGAGGEGVLRHTKEDAQRQKTLLRKLLRRRLHPRWSRPRGFPVRFRPEIRRSR